MSVRIDEPREGDSAAQIEFLRVARRTQRLDPPTRANRSDAVIMDEQRAITDDAELAERIPAPGH
jgi:hypothetical protein